MAPLVSLVHLPALLYTKHHAISVACTILIIALPTLYLWGRKDREREEREDGGSERGRGETREGSEGEGGEREETGGSVGERECEEERQDR